MIPPTTFVWFFSLSGTSYVLPLVLYNAKKVSRSNTHIESKNQNTKRRMVTKNIPYFIFELKNQKNANSVKKTSSMSKDSSNLSKSRFSCYFCRSLVNFKNQITQWFFFGTYGLYIVCEKVDEVLCLIGNI